MQYISARFANNAAPPPLASNGITMSPLSSRNGSGFMGTASIMHASGLSSNSFADLPRINHGVGGSLTGSSTVGGFSDVRLVSLGCYCGPKLSFRKLGQDCETLPFDWVRTRIDGIIDFIQNDFDKFFHYDTKLQLSENVGTIVAKHQWLFRSYYHSFWHDDLSDPADMEKYRRRIARFKAIDAHSKPVLFVRAVANDEEIQHLDKLRQLLLSRFGSLAKLLVIVDYQPTDEPLVIQGDNSMLIYTLNARAHAAGNDAAPYVKPISAAIDWVKTGSIPGARTIQSLSKESFQPNKMAWILPSVHEPFEITPSGGMKPLTCGASGAINGLPPLCVTQSSANQGSYIANNLSAPWGVTQGSAYLGSCVPQSLPAPLSVTQSPAYLGSYVPQSLPAPLSVTQSSAFQGSYGRGPNQMLSVNRCATTSFFSAPLGVTQGLSVPLGVTQGSYGLTVPVRS